MGWRPNSTEGSMDLVRSLRFAPVLLVACSLVASADFPCGTTRTYFGGPGTGPYGVPERPQNPWTGKFFGLRCCKTKDDCYMDYLKRVSIAEARYQARVNRACPDKCWWGNLSGNLCGGPCACSADCASGCGDACGAGCGKGCGKGHFGGKRGPGGHAGPGAYAGGYGAGMNPLPPMNREDAVRYAEGFQYYPPYHLLRSPRDFFMFDVKYGIGR